jgi:putative tricarboxylic transport membrane protein
MSQHSADSDNDNSPSLVSNRTMEMVTALLFLVVAVIAVVGTLQIGAGWRDDGPAPGFFPFWCAVLMAVASLINLFNAIKTDAGEEGSFVSRSEFGRVLTVFLPSLLYVALIGGVGHGAIGIGGLGIYVASFLFILCFMYFIGKEALWKCGLVAVLVPLVTFFMFEKWFKVALPKGPLEAWLGFA